MRRAAACSRSLRVRRRWLARPEPSTSMVSVLRQLPLDRGEIDPHILAPDLAFASELDDMQQPEFERPVAAFEAEGASGGAALPERFIDQEIIAIEPLQALNAAFREIDKEAFV